MPTLAVKELPGRARDVRFARPQVMTRNIICLPRRIIGLRRQVRSPRIRAKERKARKKEERKVIRRGSRISGKVARISKISGKVARIRITNGRMAKSKGKVVEAKAEIKVKARTRAPKEMEGARERLTQGKV
jgi:hypothetical protein